MPKAKLLILKRKSLRPPRTRQKLIEKSAKGKYVKHHAAQVEMALNSLDTKKSVKDCLKTIIGEISSSADMRLMDFSLVRAALPNIINSLDNDYATGFMHSIRSILEYETDSFQRFHEAKMDEQPEEADVTEGLIEMAGHLSEAMKNPLMPERLYNVLADEFCEQTSVTHAPAIILAALQPQVMQPQAEHSEQS